MQDGAEGGETSTNVGDSIPKVYTKFPRIASHILKDL